MQIAPQAEVKATTIPMLSSAATNSATPAPAGIQQPAANTAGVITTTPAPFAQQQALPQAVPAAIDAATTPTKVIANPNPVTTAKPSPVVAQQPKSPASNQTAQGNTTTPSQPDVNNLGMALPEPGLE